MLAEHAFIAELSKQRHVAKGTPFGAKIDSTAGKGDVFDRLSEGHEVFDRVSDVGQGQTATGLFKTSSKRQSTCR